MIYFIDGYNLLFFAIDDPNRFLKQKQEMIAYLQSAFLQCRLSGFLVFDGKHRREEESGRSYDDPLEIVYAPKGQSADQYIVEKVSLLKNPKEAMVVTNDKGIIAHVRELGALTSTNASFLKSLHTRSAPIHKEKLTKDTPKNIERLLRIFEKGD